MIRIYISSWKEVSGYRSAHLRLDHMTRRPRSFTTEALREPMPRGGVTLGTGCSPVSQTGISMDEFVKCTGRLHGVVFWLPVLLIVPPLLLVLPFQWATLIGLAVILLARLRQETTKIILTNRRAIIRRGIGRTAQINLAQVESIKVARPLLGIIFNYGTVTICGSGGTKEKVDTVADPLRFQELYD